MPTKFDVFAELIEKAPCSASNLPFKTPIYQHLKSLMSEKLIKKEKIIYTPIKNKKSQAIFSIIKYCLKNGLDYNTILSKNVPKVVEELFLHAPKLRPKNLFGNKENSKILSYLEKHQFTLIIKKRPREGIILKHQLFDHIKDIHHIKTDFKTSIYKEIANQMSKIKEETINPFDNKVFEFLAGSAGLEGSTITIGETKDLLINDIYPDKPKKDIQMVKNLNEAMYYLLEHLNEDITEEKIKEINKLVLFSLHRNAGKYKSTPNKIQGNPSFKTTLPKRVSKEMKAYCKKILSKEGQLEKLGFIHNELQRIHPFSDGNSRTTRMILNWVLLKNKSPLLVIKMGCFDEYMSLTKLSKERNDKKLTELFHHIIVHENLITLPA